MARSARRRKKNRPIGCLVWFALLLTLAVVFLACRSTIAKAIDSSGLARLLGLRGTHTSQAEPAPQAAGDGQQQPPAGAGTSPGGSTPRTSGGGVAPSGTTTASGAPAPAASQKPASDKAPGPVTPEAKPKASTSTATSGSNRPTQSRRGTLYFVKVGDDGSVALSGLARQVSFTDSPLTETLKALVAGPLPDELERGFRSLIPDGTRVEDVYVKERTAYVSFNEPFRFNPFGRDGHEAQLRQIVYTVTEFGNIDRVQILIGGKVTDYLGPEGIRIREPLSRQSFAENRL